MACYNSRPNVNNVSGEEYTPLGLPPRQLPPTQSTDNNSSFSVVHNVNCHSEDAQTANKHKMIVLSSSSSSNSASPPPHADQEWSNGEIGGGRKRYHNWDESEDGDYRPRLVNSDLSVPNFKPASHLQIHPQQTSNPHVFGRTVAKEFSSNTNRQDMCFGKAGSVLPSWVNAQRQNDGAVLEKTQSDTIKSAVLHQQQLQQSTSCQATYEEIFECLLKGETLQSTSSNQPNVFTNWLHSKKSAPEIKNDKKEVKGAAQVVNNSNLLNQHIQREIDMLSINAKAGSVGKESSVEVHTSQVESQECYDRIFEENLEVVHMHKTKADQAFDDALTSMTHMLHLQQTKIKQMEQELMAKDKELATEKENNSKLKRIISRQKGLFLSINSLVAVPMRFLTHGLSQIIKETVLEEPILNMTAIGNIAINAAAVDWQD